MTTSTLRKLKASKEPLKLNLGCGTTKITGCINIDVEASCKPDLVHDFAKEPLPFDPDTVHEIYFFHTIEHIKKALHKFLLMEFHRVLIPNGAIYISYPNFVQCVENWKTNYKGMKRFWEATIFGRQLYPSDHHVCIMEPIELQILLKEVGFHTISSYPEPTETYNSVTLAYKGTPYKTYEELVTRATRELRIIK